MDELIKNVDVKEMGRRFKLVRQRLGLTQTDVANELDTTQLMIHRIEKGENILSPMFLALILFYSEIYLDYSFLQLLPYFGKYWCILCIAFRDTMYPLTPIIIVVRFRLDQTVERVNYLPVTHHDYSHGADT